MTAKAWIVAAAVASLYLVGLPATPSFAEETAETTIVVTLDDASSDAATAASQAVSAAGGNVTEVRQITDTTVAVTVDQGGSTAARVGDRAEDRNGIRAAETAKKVYATTTDDDYYSYLWDLSNAADSHYGVNAEDAWPTSTGTDVVVGVIDTGITAHLDLTGSASAIVGGNVIAGYDFISDTTSAGDSDGWDANPSDEGDYHTVDSNLVESSWHGTHVSGTIAAIANNAEGIAGVAPGALVQPVRVLGRAGGSEVDLVAAITWGAGLSVAGVADNPTPADILNLSLGGGASCPTSIQTAIDNAVAAGTAVVVAAGNDDIALANSFPANCNNVISVVATTYEGTRASYSNYGTSGTPATVSAPGGSAESGSDPNDWILSTWNSGTTVPSSAAYGWMVGTSMAAPHVAGVAALVKAAKPSLTVAQLTELLTSTAKDAVSCTADACGAGIVDAPAAVAAAGSSPSATPTPTPTPTPSPSAERLSLGTLTLSGPAKVGVALRASASVSPAAATLAWRWTLGGTVVSTAASYTPPASASGKDLTIQVTATYGSQTSIAAKAVRVAAGTFIKSASPKASGTYRVGRKLKASKGTWAPTPTSYSYQWLRNGKKIKGATKATYKLTRSDRYKKVSVKVTVKRVGHTSTSATSKSHRIR